MNRREFLRAAGLTGAALILPLRLDAAPADPVALGDFVALLRDGRVRLVVARSEMGQGVRTTLAAILAEELDLAWSQVAVVQAPGDARFGSQSTEGSFSITSTAPLLHSAGARVRRALVEAAAAKWQADPAQLTTRDGAVHDASRKRRASYASLASAAAKRGVPKDATPKPRAEWKLLGKPLSRVDGRDIVRGRARYGADLALPGMRHAVLVRAPFPAARIVSVDEGTARATPGVLELVRLDARSAPFNTFAAIAVVARDTWSAIAGARRLAITWTQADTRTTADAFEAWSKLGADALEIRHSTGDADAALRDATTRVAAEYRTAFAVHAPIEPAACVAEWRDGSLALHAPTQDPQLARKLAAQALGIDEARVRIEVTLLGGGFGRKSQPDFVIEAAELAQKLGGAVKLQWTREDEMRHGFYRPGSLQRVAVGLDAAQRPRAWKHETIFPSVSTVLDAATKRHDDWELDGAINLPYRIDHLRVAASAPAVPVRVVWMRSVSSWHHAFAVNSMLDELAAAARRDPVDYQLELLGDGRVIEITEDEKKFPIKFDTARLAGVLRRVRDEARARRAADDVLGFACTYLRFSYVAIAAHVRRRDDGRVELTGFDCAVDCGPVLNPLNARAQVEGGVLYALAGAIGARVEWGADGVVQTNFHAYPLLRNSAAVEVRAYFVEGDPATRPTGLGEIATGAVAPALANALFAATGKRVRELPLGAEHFA